jgi:hypothetical protein
MTKSGTAVVKSAKIKRKKTPRMRLITPMEASQAVYVTRGMIHYWVRKGRVQKHYTEGNSYNYLVDLDEVIKAQNWKEELMKTFPKDLITRNQAADLLWVSASEISYYARKGYIQKYYVLGNSKNYLVSESEVRQQPKLIPLRVEARNPILRQHALNQPKDSRGKFLTPKR